MRQNLAELLASAVSSTYGSYYGSVLAALTTRSRATSAHLVRALPKLSSGDVRLALVTLVQQRLVNHHTDGSSITYYEPNWENAYNFTCRLPTLHKFVEERFDSKVAEAFDSVAQAGAALVRDLVAQVKSAEDTANKLDTMNARVGTNGDARPNGVGTRQAPTEREKELYGALNLLLTAGYIMRVNIRQFWPAHDREAEAINEMMLAKFPAGTSAKKERDALQEESSKLLRRWRNEDENFFLPSVTSTAKTGRKRALSPDFPDFRDDFESRPTKRRQLSGQLLSTVGQFQTWLLQHQDPLDVSWPHEKAQGGF
jgi:hypothetical protein